MGNHLGFTWKSPNKTTSIRGGVLFGRADTNCGLVNMRCSLVHDVHEHLDESIGHHFFIIVIRKFEGVVKKDVGLVFVIVGIDNLLNKKETSK